uniref:Uncharacterized protein n=1 Tax=Anguilla anguilla TaxID=7936 RepID=A0A0E9PKI1_ANGAN
MSKEDSGRHPAGHMLTKRGKDMVCCPPDQYLLKHSYTAESGSLI